MLLIDIFIFPGGNVPWRSSKQRIDRTNAILTNADLYMGIDSKYSGNRIILQGLKNNCLTTKRADNIGIS